MKQFFVIIFVITTKDDSPPEDFLYEAATGVSLFARSKPRNLLRSDSLVNIERTNGTKTFFVKSFSVIILVAMVVLCSLSHC